MDIVAENEAKAGLLRTPALPILSARIHPAIAHRRKGTSPGYTARRAGMGRENQSPTASGSKLSILAHLRLMPLLAFDQFPVNLL